MCDVTVGAVAARYDRGGIGAHTKPAHGQTQQIRSGGGDLPSDVHVAARKPTGAKRKIWPLKRWQECLYHAQGEHLTHFGETLPGGLAGPTMPASMLHAGEVTKARPKVVGGAD